MKRRLFKEFIFIFLTISTTAHTAPKGSHTDTKGSGDIATCVAELDEKRKSAIEALKKAKIFLAASGATEYKVNEIEASIKGLNQIPATNPEDLKNDYPPIFLSFGDYQSYSSGETNAQVDRKKTKADSLKILDDTFAHKADMRPIFAKLCDPSGWSTGELTLQMTEPGSKSYSSKFHVVSSADVYRKHVVDTVTRVKESVSESDSPNSKNKESLLGELGNLLPKPE
ncbi:MAG: hypothetical protein R3A80_05285 [Bdellovibrionota bacterium]